MTVCREIIYDLIASMRRQNHASQLGL